MLEFCSSSFGIFMFEMFILFSNVCIPVERVPFDGLLIVPGTRRPFQCVSHILPRIFILSQLSFI